jgi:hypothetical protein
VGGLGGFVASGGPVAAAVSTPVTVTVTTSPTSTNVYGTVTMSADVVPADGPGPDAPTGTVTFYVTQNGTTTQVGQVNCPGGSGGTCAGDQSSGTVFALTTSNNTFPAGNDGAYTAQVTASYSGDSNFMEVGAASSTLASVTVNLNQVLTNQWSIGVEGLQMPQGDAVVGQQVTISTGLPGIQNLPGPTGTVTFYAQPVNPSGTEYLIGPSGGINTGCPNSCGGEAFTMTAGNSGQLGVGSYNIIADYSGDNVFAPASISTPLTVTQLNQIPTGEWNLNEQVPNMPQGVAVVGQQITLSTNGVPCAPSLPCTTGTVSFYAQPLEPSGSQYQIGSTTGAGGTSFTITAGANGQLIPGTYNIVANYSGDDVYAAASISIPLTVTQLNQVPPSLYGVNVSVQNQANGIAVVGQQLTLSIGGGCVQNLACPSGTMTYYAQPLDPSGSEYLLGSPITCQNQNCGSNESITVTAGANDELEPGSYNIVAEYSGDSVFAPTSFSTPLTVYADSSIQNGGLGFCGPNYISFGQVAYFGCGGVGGASGWPAPTGTVTVTATPTSTPAPALPQDYSWPVTLATVSGSNNICCLSLAFPTGNGSSDGMAQLPIGSYTITASYTGDSIYAPQTVSVPFTVGTTYTNTALGGSSPSQGNAVTYTATVTSDYGSPVTVGSVTFDDAEGNPITGCGAQSVNASGIATCQVSYPWDDTVAVTAQYTGMSDQLGNIDFQPSTSNTVNSTASTAAVSLTAASTTTVGAAEPLSATVAPAGGSATTAFPTGTVTFYYDTSQGSVPLGTVSCSGATSSLCTHQGNGTVFGPISTVDLGAGNATITATYSGDGNYPSANSSSVAVQVNLNSFTTTPVLYISANPALLGQTVAFTLADSPNPGAPCPSGTATFFSQASGGSRVQIGKPVLLSPYLCDWPGVTIGTGTGQGELGAGTYTITASYSGDDWYVPATQKVALTVLDPVTATLSAAATVSAAGEPVTLTATLTPTEQNLATLPSGTVTFSGPHFSARVALAASDCTRAAVCKVALTTKSLPPGTDSLAASYGGGGLYAASTSKPAVVKVFAPDGSGTLAEAPNTVTVGAHHLMLTFVYRAGSGGLSGGALTITVPTGWTAPSTSASAAGLVRTSLGKVTVSGRTIEISGLDLQTAGSVTITYGLSSKGGVSGVTAPTRPGYYTFAAEERSVSASTLAGLSNPPAVDVVS